MYKPIRLALLLIVGFIACTPGCRKPDEPQQEPQLPVLGNLNLTKSSGSWGNRTTNPIDVDFGYDVEGWRSYIPVDSVLLNGIPLTNALFLMYYYMDHVDTSIFLRPVTWRVAGANGIPSFTHTLTGTFPDFAVPLLSSINRDTALNIVLPPGTFAHADTAWVILRQDTVWQGHAIPSGTSTAVFTPAELNGFRANATAEMQIVVAKYDSLLMPGATFRFSRIREWNEANIRIK